MSPQGFRRWLQSHGGILAIVASGALLRSSLHFATPWVPGINGAYYLVQCRTLLERGQLAFADFPITFALHAALAQFFQQLGMQADNSIILAVKLCDSLVPPLLAVPVYLLGKRWGGEGGRAHVFSLLLAVLAVFAPPPLLMLGDFQKNSLALVGLGFLVLALDRYLESPSRPRGWTALALLAFIGLTHIGVFASAIVLVGVTWTISRFSCGERPPSVVQAALVVLVIAVTVMLGSPFDSQREQRLLSAFLTPLRFLAEDSAFHPHRLPLFPQLLTLLLAGLISSANASLPSGHRRTVALSCTATAVLIAGPWIPGDKAMRLCLNAFPLHLIGLMSALFTAQRRRRSLQAAAVLTVLALFVSLTRLEHKSRPCLPEQALEELTSLQTSIPHPRTTIIIAQHGLEWWTAWLLRTRVAQPGNVVAEDWQKATILVLECERVGIHPGPPHHTDFKHRLPPPMPQAHIPPGSVVEFQGSYLKLGRVVSPHSRL